MSLLPKEKKRIPSLRDDCIPYMEGCGLAYSHKSIVNTYVFYREGDGKQFAFTLPEIRSCFKNGW
jgi:hypothetical protein